MLGTLIGFAARTAARTAVRTAAGAAVGAGVSFAARRLRERLGEAWDGGRDGGRDGREDRARSRGTPFTEGPYAGEAAVADGPLRDGPFDAAPLVGGEGADDPSAAGAGNGRGGGRRARRDGPGATPTDDTPGDTVTDETTHFGYRTVDRESKASLVGEVFDSVAPSYDVMNDLMSFGIHRLWKRFAIEQTGTRPGQRVLDIAGGTGDLAARLARRVGSGGHVLLADINAAMLRAGRERLVDEGIVGNVDYAQGDAEALPFADDTFDCVTIAFGLRNVTDKARALASMQRVLKPGGRLLVLEFSKPVLPLLARAYDAYSFTALPLLGRLVANDADSYRYLAESIRMHPDQETLSAMFAEAGFERVEHHNMTGGIVALHKGVQALSDRRASPDPSPAAPLSASLPLLVEIALERAVRALLSHDPESGARVAAHLDGRVVRVRLRRPDIELALAVVDGRVDVLRRFDGAADVTIEGPPAALLSLREGNAALYAGEVRIEGDVALAQSLREILGGLDVDPGALLEPLVGGTLAHRLGRLGRDAGAWATRTRRSFRANAGEYLREESGLLAPGEEIERWSGEVEELRDAAERLAARVARAERAAAAAVGGGRSAGDADR